MTKKSLMVIHLPVVSVLLLILATGCKKEKDDPVIKDGDGNVYSTITIGTQIWLTENLKTTKLTDGTVIPHIEDNTFWANTNSPDYCWYNNEINNKNTYGALYNWHAVSTGKLCPSGWHVPSVSELNDLVDFLGGESVAGGKLKTTGTIEGGDGLWYQQNVDATNTTEFSAVPGGLRNNNGLFFDLGFGGVWWTSTQNPPDLAYYYFINNFNAEFSISITGTFKRAGFSVRCIKD